MHSMARSPRFKFNHPGPLPFGNLSIVGCSVCTMRFKDSESAAVSWLNIAPCSAIHTIKVFLWLTALTFGASKVHPTATVSSSESGNHRRISKVVRISMWRILATTDEHANAEKRAAKQGAVACLLGLVGRLGSGYLHNLERT